MSAVDDMRPVRSRRWVLIEQPGPWGSSDPRDSDLEPGVADQLIDWARQSGLDLRLIRRNPRRYRPGTRTAFVVDADRHTPRMRRLSLDRVADIMSVDCAGPMAMGEPAERPLYAIGGRCGRELLRSRREHPLTSAFAAQRPDQTWEISQAGDDRGPVALAIFPQAVLYSRLGPASAPVVVAAHERGEVALEWWRGRAGDAWEVQVAEHLVRRSTGRARLADLADMGVLRHSDDEATVGLALDGAGTIEVRVRRSRADEIGRPVCSGACGAAERYELVSMRVASEARVPPAAAFGVA